MTGCEAQFCRPHLISGAGLVARVLQNAGRFVSLIIKGATNLS